MSLLGMPARRPALQLAYWMPHELYDETDEADHPLLVVANDPSTRSVRVVTRTSRFEARGPLAVAHPPQPELHLDRPGWWRLHKRHQVPWGNFADPDVEVLGTIDDRTWARVVDTLTQSGGAR